REDNDLLGYTTVVIDSTAPVDSQIVRQQYKEQVPAYGAAVWKGIAVYLRFTVSDALAFIVRGEVFDDLNGVRTGTSQSLREVTLTPEWKPTEHLTLRGDLRFDHSSALVFNHGGNVWGSQTTASVNALYSF
ncbi:MAG TPA: outer membrane beta-barrel protein, partial [Candidatus Kapabacteria bacterium]|nr:outer membrane beta-barrel protein [Candidatus Kapabacteria bacterium]